MGRHPNGGPDVGAWGCQPQRAAHGPGYADYRKVLKAPDGYFKKTQYPLLRERAIREFNTGYDKHPSPRVRTWYRDVLSVSKAGQMKQLQEPEDMLASHSRPRWGNDRIQEVTRGQRDTYANPNNGVLHLACHDAWPESTIFGAACGKHYFRHGVMGNAAKTDRPSELEQASTPSFHH